MGEFIQDGDRMRELVLVRCPPCEGNEAGTVRRYRDQLKEGDEVVGEENVIADARPAKQRRKG